MPAKKKPAPNLGPQHKHCVKVPIEMGGGRVSLYEIAGGLPELVPAVEPKVLAGHKFVMVHFPSRRWVPLKNLKDWGLARSEIIKGNNPHNILLGVKVGKREKKVARAQAHARPSTGAKQGSKPPVSEAFTEVPPALNFDQAMDHVFPVARLTREYERLLRAEEQVYNKEGQQVGTRPAFATQFQALKALTEWRVGRPSEKEKPPEEKKRLSHDELIQWLSSNEDAVEYMEEVLKKIRHRQAAAKTVSPAPSPASKPS